MIKTAQQAGVMMNVRCRAGSAGIVAVKERLKDGISGDEEKKKGSAGSGAKAKAAAKIKSKDIMHLLSSKAVGRWVWPACGSYDSKHCIVLLHLR
eukprot:12430649-Karenia_brevis.AAC.1